MLTEESEANAALFSFLTGALFCLRKPAKVCLQSRNVALFEELVLLSELKGLWKVFLTHHTLCFIYFF